MDIYHASLLVISAVLLATCIAQAIIIRRREKVADFFDAAARGYTQEMFAGQWSCDGDNDLTEVTTP